MKRKNIIHASWRKNVKKVFKKERQKALAIVMTVQDRRSTIRFTCAADSWNQSAEVQRTTGSQGRADDPTHSCFSVTALFSGLYFYLSGHFPLHPHHPSFCHPVPLWLHSTEWTLQDPFHLDVSSSPSVRSTNVFPFTFLFDRLLNKLLSSSFVLSFSFLSLQKVLLQTK